MAGAPPESEASGAAPAGGSSPPGVTTARGARGAPDRILDVRGLACPIPVARTAQAMRELQSGRVLEVLASDPDAELDVRAWALRSGDEILHAERHGEVTRLLVRRA